MSWDFLLLRLASEKGVCSLPFKQMENSGKELHFLKLTGGAGWCQISKEKNQIQPIYPPLGEYKKEGKLSLKALTMV